MNHKKRIGVVSYKNDQNFGNVMVKFAMYKKLKEYNLNPVIISKTPQRCNIDFLNKTVKLKEIKNDFSELNENDYDIMMVNSDQVWNFNNSLNGNITMSLNLLNKTKFGEKNNPKNMPTKIEKMLYS